MDIMDIDVTKLEDLADDLIAIAASLDSYIESFEEYINNLQERNVWKGYTSTNYRIASKQDIIQYKKYSKTMDTLGKSLKAEAEALESEIAALKDV